MKRMRKIIVFLFVMTLGCGCHRSSTSAKLQFDPPTASPGASVTAQSGTNVFSKERVVSFTIEKQSAAIQGKPSDNMATFTLPNLEPGMKAVSAVNRAGKEVARGTLEVLPATSLRLLLTMKDGRLQLINSRPTSGGFTENRAEDGERWSYDILTPQGGLLFTGAVASPSENELFDEPRPGERSIRREPMEHEATFVIKIPNVQQQATVRFFEARTGVNLATAEGRASRKQIGEIKLGGS